MTTTAVSSSRTYNSLGRLTSSTEGSSTVSYGYDLKGQLTSITYPGTLTVTRTSRTPAASSPMWRTGTGTRPPLATIRTGT